MLINPFTPNFGEVPMHLAGRDQEVRDVIYMLDGATSAPSRTSIFIGARGSGKTALLSYLGREAEMRGWINVNTGCVKGMREDMIQQTSAKLNELFPQDPERKLNGISLGKLIGLTWENDDFRPNWRTRITGLLEILQEHDTGLLITIDEINPKQEELILFASDYQLLIRENRKIALLMAGLPKKVTDFVNKDETTFLRRASQYSLENVSSTDIQIAFQNTVEDSGKRIEKKALDEAVEAIGGFPYMMQLIGFRAWQYAGEKELITPKEVESGIEAARKDFEDRVIRNTVEDLSELDREFLEAMLEDDGPSRIADIQKRMEKDEKVVARYRIRLIDFGVIEPAGRGLVRFAIPGLKEYLQRIS